jgi:choline kinase
MISIILAAGRGTRMSPLTDDTPKSLLPFKGETVLTRLIGQIDRRTKDRIIVVVGHEKDRIIDAVNSANEDRVEFIINYDYKNDVNILSLSLAVKDIDEKFIVFESDCLFDNNAMDAIFSSELDEKSSWYSIGKFFPNQVGGIVASDNNNVLDVKVVPKFESKFRNYDKLVGVLRVGPNEFANYKKYLLSEVKISTMQYYLMPWIKNLPLLPCKCTSLADFHANAFNTPSEYHKILDLFKENDCEYIT